MTPAPPLVSVVTPVHNGESYLAECLDSVLAQSYSHWEHVVVENRSTDRSLEIAQAYARRDPRVRVVTTDRLLTSLENQNHALRQISPEATYCKVVHADDWLFPDCLLQMVALAEAHPTVGIVSSYRLDDRWVDLDGLPYPSTVVPGRQIARQTLLGGPDVFGSPTSLLLRAEVVRAHDPFYDETHPWADTAACYRVLQDWDFGFVHQVLTYTRRHEASYSATVRTQDTKMLAHLSLLTRFGPVFLTPEEYGARLSRTMDAYYEFLGKGVFQGRGAAFWDYHRRGLEALGYRLGRADLVFCALRAATRVVLRPAVVVARVLRRAPARLPAATGGGR